MKVAIYNIDLKIDVNNNYIESEVNLKFLMSGKTNGLNFYIYKELEIDTIECDKNIIYEVSKDVSNWSPFIEESKLIRINFKEQIDKNDKVNFLFKYRGKIGTVSKSEINRISNSWVELGIYSPWFPLFEDFRKCIFNVNIDITEGYEVLNAELVKNVFIINNDVPSSDCTIIASKNLKVYTLNLGKTNLNLYYLEDSQKNISYKLFSDVSHIMKFYSKFGKIECEKISIVNLPRKNGGGYCRDNLIVLNLDEEEGDIDTFRFISHELAHLWWNKACTNSFEDWLNESFAEFSALLAVRKVFGEEEFTKRIKLYEEESKGLPAIINLNREDKNAYECLYRKGPVILNKLMQDIGQDGFYNILMERYRNNVNTTEELIRLIEGLTSKNVAERFVEMLGN